MFVTRRIWLRTTTRRASRCIPGVAEVAVVGTPDAIREEAIVAYVVPEESGKVSIEQD
jgi:acyl-coenzyme A synthetase/AMP-(fatty) acid ligase